MRCTLLSNLAASNDFGSRILVWVDAAATADLDTEPLDGTPAHDQTRGLQTGACEGVGAFSYTSTSRNVVG